MRFATSVRKMWLALVCAIASGRRGVVDSVTPRWDMPVHYHINETSLGSDSAAALQSVLAAAAAITAKAPGVTFLRSDVPPFVDVRASAERCSSAVGRTAPGAQVIHLTPRCATLKGVVIHELMHTLGFSHEQLHPNRSTFIVVSDDPALYDSAWQEQWRSPLPNASATPFDPCSIMMYPVNSADWRDVAVNYTEAGYAAAAACVVANARHYEYEGSAAAFVRRDPANAHQMHGLSQGDVMMLNALYPPTPSLLVVDPTLFFWVLLIILVVGVTAVIWSRGPAL